MFEGDQAGLVGPNGAGKSTLLKILTGDELPDRGTRSLRAGVGSATCLKIPTFPAGAPSEDVVTAALAGVDEEDRPGRLAQTLGRAGFADGRAAVDALSGGWRKRLAIAREIAAEPDVLLMDEPTNHLDVDGILWLEGLLPSACAGVPRGEPRPLLPGARGHAHARAEPRYPGGLFQTDGRYSEFLSRRDEFLRGQAAYQDALANTVRREIEWLRQGAKARSTKAKGRIKEAGRLMEELEDRRARSVTATAGIDFASTQRRTRRLLAARGLTKSLGGRRLVSDLDLVVTPGTRVGVIGPNGSGKTTLLNLLAGALTPRRRRRSSARTGLRVVRFEQERGGLDPAAEPAPRARSGGRRRHLAGPQRPRGRVGQALSVPARATRRAGGPPLGRRAGAHPHRRA